MATIVHTHTQAQIEAVKHTRSGSYIFHGPAGMGKTRLAYELAADLGCTSPDLITVRPEDKPSILIEQVRGLVQALSLRVYNPGGTRLVVIEDAHLLTIEAQNALLKLIEEPPAGTVFILVTDRVEALLPTVRSRCAAVFFPQLPAEQIVTLLTREHNIKPSDATALATAAHGAPGIAVMLATNAEEAATRLQLSDLAASIPSAGTFDRLLLAKRLVDAKADLHRFARLLQAGLVAQIRSGEHPPHSDLSFEALERFRRALMAKVAPRVALERLMLEL